MSVRFGAIAMAIGGVSALVGVAAVQDADSSWPTYGGTPASLKYAPLDQIDRTNAGALKIAWRWRSIDEDTKQEVGVRPWLFEATPLLIGRTLYLSTGLGQIAAVDAATGRTIWTHDPKTYTNRVTQYGFTHRGVAYWPGAPGVGARILMGTVDGYLLAVDADTGKPSAGFGRDGRVDLLEEWPGVERRLYSVTSPPMVVGNVAVLGSGLADAASPLKSQPPGDVRGFDVRTGRRLWTFHSVPRAGEVGHDTWDERSLQSPRASARGRSSAPTRPSATSTCPSAHPRATTTAAIVTATTCTGPASCASRQLPASASGISRRRATTCGTTIHPRRPSWPTSPCRGDA